MDVKVGLWRKLSTEKLMLLDYGIGEDCWESLGLQGDPTSPSERRSVLGVHWKDWCWSWNSNTLAISCEELTHWTRPWCWEGLGAGGEGEDRGWDGWMASPTRWAWVWVNSGSLWWTGRPGVLWFMGLQRVGHDWAADLTDWLTENLWRIYNTASCIFGKGGNASVTVCISYCITVFQLIFFPGDWILYRKNTQYGSSKPTKQNVQWQKHMGYNHELYWLPKYISHDRNESTNPPYIFIAQVQTASSLFGTW